MHAQMHLCKCWYPPVPPAQVQDKIPIPFPYTKPGGENPLTALSSPASSTERPQKRLQTSAVLVAGPLSTKHVILSKPSDNSFTVRQNFFRIFSIFIPWSHVIHSLGISYHFQPCISQFFLCLFQISVLCILFALDQKHITHSHHFN